MAIIEVLALPPIESLRMWVNFESLYDICFSFLIILIMTLDKFKRDLLIFPPSFALSPTAPVLFILSEPAKSIIWNTLFFILFSFISLFSIYILIIAWLLELSLFIKVSAVFRNLFPSIIYFIASSGELIINLRRFWTVTTPFISLNWTFCLLSGFNKSFIFSLYISK